MCGEGWGVVQRRGVAMIIIKRLTKQIPLFYSLVMHTSIFIVRTHPPCCTAIYTSPLYFLIQRSCDITLLVMFRTQTSSSQGIMVYLSLSTNLINEFSQNPFKDFKHKHLLDEFIQIFYVRQKKNLTLCIFVSCISFFFL